MSDDNSNSIFFHSYYTLPGIGIYRTSVFSQNTPLNDKKANTSPSLVKAVFNECLGRRN